MPYAAFVSYSHAADGKLAPALQQALHRFAKPWYRRRALRVFRDKTSLAANPALWPAIELALGDSLWFLYMASPPAAQSHWVQKEVQWWLEHRSSDKMLMLLTDGDLSWDSGTQDFDWGRTTAVPQSLRGQFKDEPLYVDLRWARSDEELSLRHSRFRSAILDIAAPLHGKPKEDLDGEDVRQDRRNKTWAWSAGGALAVLAVAATTSAIYAVQQRDEALRQRDEAVARQLRTEAQRLGPIDNQQTTAVLLMIESLRRAQDASSYEMLWSLANAGARPVARFIAKQRSGPLAFSPDGRLIATGDDDALVIFETLSAREVTRIPFPEVLWAIGFSPNGDRIVGGGEASVRVFEISTKRELARLDQGSTPNVFGFSPDGQFLAIASVGKVRVIDVFAGRVLNTIDHDGVAPKVFLSAGGTRLGLASDRTALLIDTVTGSQIAVPARGGAISSISFSADGKRAAVASYGKNDSVGVFDVETGQEHASLSPGSTTAWFSRQGALLATEPEYSVLHVRDVDAGQDVARLKLRDSVARLDWSDDGELLAIGTGDRDGSTAVFQTGSWRQLARLKHQGSVQVQSLAISPKGNLVASAANRVTSVFAAREGTPLVQMESGVRLPQIAFSADGKVVAGVVERRIVVVAESKTNRPIARFDVCNGARALSLSADGKRLALGCPDGEAPIVDVSTSKIVGRVPHRLTTPLVISPDGKLVFSVGREGSRVAEADGGHEVRSLGSDSVNSATFSADGKYVAVAIGGMNGAEVFETFGAQEPRRFNADELVESVAFSADGKLLAVGTRRRVADIYDVDTKRHIAALDHKEEEKETLRIRSMVFSADGRMLATATHDPTMTDGERVDTLRVFYIGSQKELVRAPLGETALRFRFSDDKAFLEIATGWRHIRTERLPLRPNDLIEDACARVARNLTPEEWSRYLGDSPFRETCPVLNPAAMEIR